MLQNLSFIKITNLKPRMTAERGNSLFLPPSVILPQWRTWSDPNRFSVYRIAYEIALVESGAFRHIRRHRTRCTTATNTATNIAGRTNSHVARLYGSGSSVNASSSEGTTSRSPTDCRTTILCQHRFREAWFRVTHARMEGTDPISLLNPARYRRSCSGSLPKIDDAIAALWRHPLSPPGIMSRFM